MGPTWGPSGADRTQVGPMLAPRTLLSGKVLTLSSQKEYYSGFFQHCLHWKSTKVLEHIFTFQLNQIPCRSILNRRDIDPFKSKGILLFIRWHCKRYGKEFTGNNGMKLDVHTNINRHILEHTCFIKSCEVCNSVTNRQFATSVISENWLGIVNICVCYARQTREWLEYVEYI